MLKTNQKLIGLIAGALTFIILQSLMAFFEMDARIRNTASIAILMAVWWLTEAIPLAATALLPIVLFPLLKVVPIKQIVLSYADSNIFLYLGGFFIAIAMQRHNLHKRIALSIIYFMGTSSKRLLFGFMLSTALLSMWISNTATTMMMLPIGIAIIEQFRGFNIGTDDKGSKNFGIALMLGIAYSASIGGVGTLIGTPPNLVFSSVVRSMFPELPEIDFIRWMIIGVPVIIVFLPLTWYCLAYIGTPLKSFKIPDTKNVIRDELTSLGKMNSGEKITLVVFVLTSLGWIFRKDIAIGQLYIPGWAGLTGVANYVNDATVAMTGAILLFIIPVNIRKLDFVLNWDWARRIPWGILILFGGGLALSKGFQVSGLDVWIGNSFKNISIHNPVILILSLCLLLTFLTEITSNVATITMFLPILAAMSNPLGVNPLAIMIPATISASCAFMMPVATPPNAIVFGSGFFTIQEMAKKGLMLNFMGVIIITSLMYLVAFPLLGIVIFK